jgi:VWFA-related protein
MFRSTVDLVAVDVQVVGKDGAPLGGLGIDDFQVTLNGHPRRLVSVDFIRKIPPPPPEAGGPDLPVFTPGVVPKGARVFVLAVDTNSFTTSNLPPAMRTAHHMLDLMQPDDLVALYEYPFTDPKLDFTHDHRAVGRALDRLLGQRDDYVGNFHLSVSEVIDITAQDPDALTHVIKRECYSGDTVCGIAIQGEASSQSAYYESMAMRSLNGLNVLLRGLGGLEGRKTVVLLSGGLVTGDRVGGRPDLNGLMTKVGAEAGASNTNLYVLHVDDSFLDGFSAAKPSVLDAGDRMRSLMRDNIAMASGLDLLAGSSGGALIHTSGGFAAYDRIMRESEAYYLLGVQPVQEDRDGALHFLNVKVRKRGVTVRSRTHVVIPVK